MDLGTVVPAVIGAAAALATSAGEKILSRYFDKSTKRELHRDEDLKVLERVTFEIRDLATAYWSAPVNVGSDDVVAGSIVGRLTFISALVDELFRDKLNLLREIHVAMNRFDVSCTDGEFGGKARVADPGRCRQIEITAYTLVHRANTLRRLL